MKYYGLIIPRSYNDYFSRSSPADIKEIVNLGTDSQLNETSAAPIQNKAVAKLVPAAASETNRLADKEFVNSTVGTNTAIFRGTYNSIAELEAYAGEKTNNDYAFVIETDGGTKYNRYKYNGSEWEYEYTLNNSSFTAEQWAAIESGITAEKVAQFEEAGGIESVNLTLAEYEALPDTKLTDGVYYNIIESNEPENTYIERSYTITTGSDGMLWGTYIEGYAIIGVYLTENAPSGKNPSFLVTYANGQKVYGVKVVTINNGVIEAISNKTFTLKVIYRKITN